MKHVNLRNLNSSLADDYDLFICSSSFEDRCISAPQKLKKKKFSRVVVIQNKSGSEVVKKNTQTLCELFEKKAKLLTIDYSNSLEIADKILPEIKRQSSGKKTKILVDITTFTHETLMVFLKIVSVKKSQVSVTCLYTNALDYCPNKDIEKKWLSRGCKDLHSILGYSGLLFPSQKNRLVLIVGYEYNRAADVISLFEPSYLTLIYGTADNATTEKNKNANRLYFELVQQLSFSFADIETIEIPCDDPDKTTEILCGLYKTHPDENIIVIPMNNKLSTIGVAKSILFTDHVQACYAPAVLYNEMDYSSPGNTCYIYDFDISL